MKRAFLFDVDGVLAKTEPVWEIAKKEMFAEFFNTDVAARMGPTAGIDIDSIYALAVQSGGVVDREAFRKAFFEKADWVYQNATLTPGLEELGEALTKYGYGIGVVSGSPMKWIDGIIDRLPFKQDIEHIISLEDRPDLAHKPAPDGYLETMRQMGSLPETTLILEDSNVGIASAKASGAYTIALTLNLIPGYIQKGADVSVDSLEEVIKLIKSRT